MKTIRMATAVKYCTVLMLLLTSVSRSFAGDTLRVLFIGNSYTQTNDLPTMVSNLAASAGDKLIYNSSVPGGYTFEQHSTYAPTLSLISSGNWDYVVLQEQSQRPSFSDAQVETEVYPYAHKLDSIIKKYNPCAKTVFYMTWGRKNGDALNCPVFPPVCTYKGMDSMLQLRYRIMSDSNNALLCPVAKVWRRLINTSPIELYNPDESHPSMEGTYAAACAFYSVLFKKDPTICTYSASLSPTNASTIKIASKEVVFDSLKYWYEFDPKIKAGFSYSATGTSVMFTNVSVNADAYDWDFGDGNTASTPSPTHAYASGGTYAVRLIAKHCKDSDTLMQMVNVTGTGIEHITNTSFTVYPNPAQQTLHISSTDFITEYSIKNSTGTTVIRESGVHNKTIDLDLNMLPYGHYLLHLQCGNNKRIMPFYKQ